MKTEILESLCISDIPLINTFCAQSKSYPMKNQGRRHYGLLYTAQGCETYHFSDRDISAVPHSVLIVPKGEKYTITLEGDVSRVIDIDFELTGNMQFRPFLIKLNKSNSAFSLFEEAEAQWKKQKNGYIPLVKSHFYRIISLLIHRESSYLSSENSKKLEESVKYLHSHYMDPGFRIDTLPKIAGISQRYFEKLFFDEFGLTPKKYVTDMRIRLAKELLMNEKCSVSDVCCQLGYSDIYHFSKLFKAKTGYAPSEFKRQQK